MLLIDLMLVLNIGLVVSSVALGILAIGGETFKRSGDRTSLTLRGRASLILFCFTFLLATAKEAWQAREHRKKDEQLEEMSRLLSLGNQGNLNFSSLRPISVGTSIDSIVNQFGPPDVVVPVLRNLPALAGSGFAYRRWTSEAITLMTLSGQSGKVAAFAIKSGAYGEPYSYQSSPIEWVIGHSTFAEAAGPSPSARFRGIEERIPRYVEKAYFGRWGHYHDFYFAGPMPEGVLVDDPVTKVKRDSAITDSMAVTGSMKVIGLPEGAGQAWEELLIAMLTSMRIEEEG